MGWIRKIEMAAAGLALVTGGVALGIASSAGAASHSKTPQACFTAISDYEKGIAIGASGIKEAAAGWLLVKTAYLAGASGGTTALVTTIVNKEKAATKVINSDAAKIKADAGLAVYEAVKCEFG